MNSAELVNLILEKLRRVKFLLIDAYHVEFIWNHRTFFAFAYEGTVRVRNVDNPNKCFLADDSYSMRIEGMLNGLSRNDEGELVKCSN